ncbi:hypothetical protein GCM10023205_82120 [Yinghuangia aomiensis]|uniref:Radical SAM core domain-containing protein n=1 Tax=Yinghuangia aomiensis TaxID=676205 RepID=A0ABP9IF11_9ACTN
MTEMIISQHRANRTNRQRRVGMLWLDLTRKCSLDCTHCYNASGPAGTHGAMTRADWIAVLDQAAEYGVTRVQLIGGEPTLHPDFAGLLARALTLGIRTQVFTNLVYVKPTWWEVLGRPGASLATSYYSADPAEHNAVTRRPSHAKTEANIATALRFGIPLRVGIVRINERQDVPAAIARLRGLGVTDIGVDNERPYGRAGGSTDPRRLCGRCGMARAAIDPYGNVSPCIMSTWVRVGNVRVRPLQAILDGGALTQATTVIQRAVPVRNGCDPDGSGGGGSGGCDPGCACAPDAYPCYPSNE